MTVSRSEQVGGRHYADAPIEPWDVIDTWPWDQRVGFYRGNALKYIMRAGQKKAEGLSSSRAAAEDVRKAEHYCRKLALVLEEE